MFLSSIKNWVVLGCVVCVVSNWLFLSYFTYIDKSLILMPFLLYFVLTCCFVSAFLWSLSTSASLPHTDIFSCAVPNCPWSFFILHTSHGCCFLLSWCILPCFCQHSTRIFVPSTSSLYVGFICCPTSFFHHFLSTISFPPQSHIRDNRGLKGVSWTQTESQGWGWLAEVAQVQGVLLV